MARNSSQKFSFNTKMSKGGLHSIGSGLHSTSAELDKNRSNNKFNTFIKPRSSVLSQISSNGDQNQQQSSLVRAIEQNYTHATQRLAPNHLSHLAIIPAKSTPKAQQHKNSKSASKQSMLQFTTIKSNQTSLRKKKTIDHLSSSRVSYFTTNAHNAVTNANANVIN